MHRDGGKPCDCCDGRVRMTLFDYDAAPDGVGTFIRLDAEFESWQAALEYHDRYLRHCWGHIKTLCGKVVYKVSDS